MSIEDIEAYAKDNNIQLKILYFKNREMSFEYFKLIYTAIKYIKSIDPVIIYSTTRTWLLALLCAIFLDSKKRITGFHDVEYHSGISMSLYIKCKLADILLRKYGGHFVFFSKYQKSLFDTKYKLSSTLLGMSVKNYGDSLKELPVYNPIKLLFFGRIESYKGLDSLIDAIEKYNDIGSKKVILSIYGRGAYWGECKKHIKHSEYFNTNIRFIENSELPDLFATHHYLALPYKDGTQSGPIMIAGAYGIPLFATEIPSFRAVYDDSNAVFFKKQDIVLALAKIASLSDSDYFQLRSNTKAVKENLSEEKIAQNYISLFDKIIELNNER